MDGRLDRLGAVEQQPAEMRTERMAELGVHGQMFGKERAFTAKGLVDDLIGDDEVSGLDFLFEAADGPGGDYVGNAQGFEGVDVGPVGDGRRAEHVPFAVAGQQGNRYAGPLSQRNGAGGLSEGGIDFSLLALVVGGKGLVEAGSADYADHQLGHCWTPAC